MPDQSALDSKYFIDHHVYNCPFCNRRHVSYGVVDKSEFAWSEGKPCYVYIVKCDSCDKRSMHLSYFDIVRYTGGSNYVFTVADIDSALFYSVPTSFFVMDERIPRALRELIIEAEASLKMNFLTGASACTRKAIYELLVHEHAKGESYEDRIKALKAKHSHVDPSLFDVLAHIQDMTSDKVHEQSWDKWDSPQLRLILETLRAVFQEIYVVPEERRERVKVVSQMRERLQKDKKAATPTQASAAAAAANGKDGESTPS